MENISPVVVICLLLCASPVSALSIQDGQVHTISTESPPLTVDYQAPNAGTTVQLLSGGTIYYGDFYGKSQYLQSDGYSWYFTFHDQSTANISGGSMHRYALYNEAQMSISGCDVSSSIDLNEDSKLILYGNDLMIYTSRIPKIFGYGTYTLSDFGITTSGFELQSHLLNGQTFSAHLNMSSETAQISVIPEPISLALLALGGLFIRRRI